MDTAVSEPPAQHRERHHSDGRRRCSPEHVALRGEIGHRYLMSPEPRTPRPREEEEEEEPEREETGGLSAAVKQSEQLGLNCDCWL
ncbi:unnamed protein product [Arctogadus glacialis]